MDELAKYNQLRWNELAAADIQWSRPLLDLDAAGARALVDQQAQLPADLAHKDVLCLAAGGGQQSAAFGVLGARVTVVDLSAAQLERDRLVAQHYQLELAMHEADMRDLSSIADPDSFDVVWQPYSINFVPSVEPVFAEVARVLRPGGLYRIELANPFTQKIDQDHWTEAGYTLKHAYLDGSEITQLFPHWDVDRADGSTTQVASPREFSHTLGTVINTLIANGLGVLGLWEHVGDDADAPPGTWDHYTSIAPPWLTLWCRLQPLR